MRAVTLSAAAATFALAATAPAGAHGLGSHTGFVSTVSTIEPHVPGLLVRVLGGHERLSVANLTANRVVIFDAQGRPLQEIPAGRVRVWAEPRIGADERPPETEGLVRYWRIPGTAGGERFEILGFLGYRPPPGAGESDDDVPTWAYFAAGAFGVLVLAAAFVVPRRRTRA